MSPISGSRPTRTVVMFVIAVLVGAFCSGCFSARSSAKGVAVLRDAEGIASYYGSKFAGRPTASGEIYNPEALTAAHRSLPFGTRLRVVRLDAPGEPTVDVRINDRGPFKAGRIIDLSRAAARELGMIDEGVVEVRLEVISYPEGAEQPSDPPAGVGW